MKQPGPLGKAQVSPGVLLLLGLLGLAACSSTRTEPDPAAAHAQSGPSAIHPGSWSTSVPIRFANNKLFVPVMLNDRHRATLLLDTGANFTVISPEMAQRAGLDVSAAASQARARMANGQEVQMSVVRLNSITVGTAKIVNFGVAVYAFTVQDYTGRPLDVDGFLGLDFLARFTMTVDPRAGTLRLQIDQPPK